MLEYDGAARRQIMREQRASASLVAGVVAAEGRWGEDQEWRRRKEKGKRAGEEAEAETAAVTAGGRDGGDVRSEGDERVGGDVVVMVVVLLSSRIRPFLMRPVSSAASDAELALPDSPISSDFLVRPSAMTMVDCSRVARLGSDCCGRCKRTGQGEDGVRRVSPPVPGYTPDGLQVLMRLSAWENDG